VLESTITRNIIAVAKRLGYFTFKIAGGPMQTAGMPDLLCIRDGRAVFLEVKRPGGKPSKLQLHRISEIRGIGGAVAEVVFSKEEAERILSIGQHHVEN
jgi:hypothetical protein